MAIRRRRRLCPGVVSGVFSDFRQVDSIVFVVVLSDKQASTQFRGHRQAVVELSREHLSSGGKPLASNSTHWSMSWIVSGLIDKFGGKSDMVGKRIKFGGWVKSVEFLTRVGKR